MAANNAAPRCYVDIYPYEGGKYSLTGGTNGVLSCITHKDIRSTGPGTFDIKLAPGGPGGPNYGPSWTEIITPMSLVVIGMLRYTHRQIVMIGVVTEPIETQVWETGRGVQRVINIRGGDFQYLFSTFSYYTLSLLGATRGVSLSQGGANLGLPELLGKSLLSGTPAQVGSAWFNVIMGGTEGILAQTNYAYNGTTVSFPNIMASLFEEYPTTDGGVRIPYSNFYMITGGNWTEKFLATFPFPWYEFFVTTAPVDYGPYQTQNSSIAYSKATNQSYVSTGMSGAARPISMSTHDGIDFLPASPTLVARVNPLPYTSQYNNGKFTMDSSRWQKNLQRFSLENTGFIKSTVAFSPAEVRNFYVINPTFFTQQFGISNSAMNAFIYTFASWIDNASIHRYGYRPEIFQIQWFSDPSGQQAQMNATQQENFQQLIQNLALRQTSYFEPTPNMAKGSVTMELRPDILPGNVFTYSPFKSQPEWDFYITGVAHSYQFGMQSTTTLSIDRGLPKTVYDNPTILTALHTGAAIRLNGEYTVPSPPVNALQPISIGTTSIQQILGENAKIFISPQGATGQ